MCLIITIGSNLTDVNECAISNGGCAGTCVNLIGGYECQCPSGYVLSNNISCTGKKPFLYYGEESIYSSLQ